MLSSMKTTRCSAGTACFPEGTSGRFLLGPIGPFTGRFSPRTNHCRSSSFLPGTLRSPGSEVNGRTMKEIELSSLHPLVTLLLREDLRHRCLLRPMKVSFASSLRTTRHDGACCPGRPFFRAARHAASVSAANASASTRQARKNNPARTQAAPDCESHCEFRSPLCFYGREMVSRLTVFVHLILKSKS